MKFHIFDLAERLVGKMRAYCIVHFPENIQHNYIKTNRRSDVKPYLFSLLEKGVLVKQQKTYQLISFNKYKGPINYNLFYQST